MMIDRDEVVEFPYTGSFYYYDTDTSVAPSLQVQEKIVVLETECNILEAGATQSSGFTSATFNIFFPYDKEEEFNLRRGHYFEGDLNGLPVTGEVIGIFPSQLSKCKVYIKDINS